ncbi:MAG: DUF1768 domain-containing protein [Oligoflexus sp.]|nr:DUF1768 domain-containing protein [Pseudopedobacter sp.]
MQLHYGNLIEQAKNGEFDVIIHGCNSFHTMGAGIAKHIKTNFPEAFEADKKTGYGDKDKIGTFSEATVERNGHTFTIINAYTQYRYGNERDQFEYDSFPQLLQDIKARFQGKRVSLPLIGCGLAGGNEPRILKMIKENFEGLDYKLVEIDLNRKLKLEEDKPNQPETPQYTYFFHLTSPFSNFHPSKFEYKELTFISNEQFMMYSKAKTFKDEATADRIINIHREFSDDGSTFKSMQDKLCYQLAGGFKRGEITRDQILNDKESVDAWNTIHKKIKQLGRGVQNYNDDVWTQKREKIVLFGARLKFSQNEDLKQVLLNTGDTYMVEASRFDPIWSCGLTEYDAKKTDPTKWPGLNLLGKVLDTLKIEIQNELTKTDDISSKKKP